MKPLNEFLNENQTISTNNFDINFEPGKVIVYITNSDTIDQYTLYDLSDTWSQYSWGYEINISNKKQEKELIKQLKKMGK